MQWRVAYFTLVEFLHLPGAWESSIQVNVPAFDPEGIADIEQCVAADSILTLVRCFPCSACMMWLHLSFSCRPMSPCHVHCCRLLVKHCTKLERTRSMYSCCWMVLPSPFVRTVPKHRYTSPCACVGNMCGVCVCVCVVGRRGGGVLVIFTFPDLHWELCRARRCQRAASWAACPHLFNYRMPPQYAFHPSHMCLSCFA